MSGKGNSFFGIMSHTPRHFPRKDNIRHFSADPHNRAGRVHPRLLPTLHDRRPGATTAPYRRARTIAPPAQDPAECNPLNVRYVDRRTGFRILKKGCIGTIFEIFEGKKEVYMSKRAVVLGGVGFIGAHLCLRLLREGCEVFCVDVRDVASSPLLHGIRDKRGFRYVHHNITNSFGIRCDEIYNLASPTVLRYDRLLPVETLRVNILGAINSLEAARMERARVLFASSGEIYGITSRSSLPEEAAATSHQMLAEGKRTAEALHRAYGQEYGIDTRIARIFNTYGSGADLNDQRVVMKSIIAALQNRDITIYGSGEQIRTFCWVEDIVDGLVRLMRAPAALSGRTVNLGSTHEITIRALVEKIVALTGSRSRIEHIAARNDDPRRKTPDISVARRELQWTPQTSLNEGLMRTIGYVEKAMKESTRVRTWVEIHG